MFPGKYNKQAGNLFFSYESSGEQVYVAGGNPRPQRLMTAIRLQIQMYHLKISGEECSINLATY